MCKQPIAIAYISGADPEIFRNVTEIIGQKKSGSAVSIRKHLHHAKKSVI